MRLRFTVSQKNMTPYWCDLWKTAMTIATAKRTNSFETTVEVCCHRVAVRYWDFDHELTDELIEELTELGEERAKTCIIEGCHNGELNCYYVDGETEEEIRGWWEIERAMP